MSSQMELSEQLLLLLALGPKVLVTKAIGAHTE